MNPPNSGAAMDCVNLMERFGDRDKIGWDPAYLHGRSRLRRAAMAV